MRFVLAQKRGNKQSTISVEKQAIDLVVMATHGRTVIGVNPYWQQIVKGLIIVVAVAFDIAKYYRRK